MKSANAHSIARIAILTASLAIACFDGGTKAQTAEDPRKEWHLVEIKCPADNGGVLETRRRNGFGDTQVVRVTYRGGAAIFLSLQNPENPATGDKGFYLDYDFQSDVGTKRHGGEAAEATRGDSFARRMATMMMLPYASKDLAHNCSSEPAERSAARGEVEAARRRFGP